MAIRPIPTRVREPVDKHEKNYRYSQATREDERRFIQNQEALQSLTAIETSLSETSVFTASARQQTIAAVAALAEIDHQDVLPVILQLKSTVRGVQRFSSGCM